jgi:tRNA(Ile)-lysidine synthase
VTLVPFDLVERCAFPPRGAPIACAVSGGADSLALLVLAAAAGCEPTAYHVDHGLRPGSAAEAEVVAAAAAALGCGFVALSVVCPPGPNLEARARAARFAALPPGVATGHTSDDRAETVLLNLLRGSGASGVTAMRPGARHPILPLRRADTEAIVARTGFAVVDDPTNRDRAIRRNRVRHELLPLMAVIADRDVVPLLNRFADLLADDAELLDTLASTVEETSVDELRRAPLPLRRRAVRRLVRSARSTFYPPDAATVARVLDVVDGAALRCEVGGGVRVRRSGGRLVVERPPEPPEPPGSGPLGSRP